MIDMTGWKMSEHGVIDSKWTVLEYVGHSKWKCQCSCGTIKEVDGSCLRRGGSKSCGRCGTKKTKTIDMTGWKMSEHGIPQSKITVIEQVPSKGGHALWKCKCNCGNPAFFIVDGSNLRSGHTLSCGCERIGINHKDYSNQFINNIWIGNVIGKNNQGSYLYDCICFCGNHFISDAIRLINGHKQSCGCLISKGEAKIKEILDELNIIYQQQYPIDDLVGEHGQPRRVDFAIFKNNQLKCFIEYQGEQHYNLNNPWNRDLVDKEKRQYCKMKNIPLLEIPYNEYNLINKDYILTKLEDRLIDF